MSSSLLLGKGLPLEVQLRWRKLVTAEVCVSCVFEEPRIFLGCGHALCATCTWDRSRRSTGGSLCRLDRCPACDAVVTFVTRLKPPTAGYRALSLDGGGVRGIVELAILRHLVEKLDLGVEAHQLFDFFAGTSAGNRL